MSATGFRRLTFSMRGVVNFSSLMKQIDVVLADKSSDSLKLVKRGILPIRRTGVSKFMNFCTSICRSVCGIESQQQNRYLYINRLSVKSVNEPNFKILINFSPVITSLKRRINVANNLHIVIIISKISWLTSHIKTHLLTIMFWLTACADISRHKRLRVFLSSFNFYCDIFLAAFS